MPYFRQMHSSGAAMVRVGLVRATNTETIASRLQCPDP